MMTNNEINDLGMLDQPQVSDVLFHPRPEPAGYTAITGTNVTIPVAHAVSLGARFHLKAPTAANVLFFHGNGEIVADYDALAPLYNRLDINLLCVDYRGYGRSSGTPSATALLSDARTAFDFTRKWLAEQLFHGPLVVMGRSLGSAAALEIAATRID
jgi:pimeloyl-ACP methyl ester carboxylesterase